MLLDCNCAPLIQDLFCRSPNLECGAIWKAVTLPPYSSLDYVSRTNRTLNCTDWGLFLDARKSIEKRPPQHAKPNPENNAQTTTWFSLHCSCLWLRKDLPTPCACGPARQHFGELIWKLFGMDFSASCCIVAGHAFVAILQWLELV